MCVTYIFLPWLPDDERPTTITFRQRFSFIVCLSLSEFWGDIAKDFYWKTKHTGQFLDYNFDVTKGEIFVKCMEGDTTNICYNVLDRNINEKKLRDKVAFYWLVCF